MESYELASDLTLTLNNVQNTGFNPYTITLQAGSTFIRSFGTLTSTITSNVQNWIGSDGQLFEGSITTSDTTSGSGAFSGDLTTVVPEPITMLGASVAVVFGAAFKRKQKQNG